MKRIILSTAATLAICATSAFAGGSSHSGGDTIYNIDDSTTNAGGAGGDGYGYGGDQEQDQSQGQSQGQGQAQGQSQNASNHNAINIEGSASASVGAAACTNGASLGIPGLGAIGASFSDRDCKIMAEAEYFRSIGRADLAMIHVQHITRIRQTMDVVRDSERAAVTDQSYDGGNKLGTAISTRTTPAITPVQPAMAYLVCDLDAAANKIVVQPRSDDQTELATAQCMASLGFVN
jgi:hypothetical protein